MYQLLKQCIILCIWQEILVLFSYGLINLMQHYFLIKVSLAHWHFGVVIMIIVWELVSSSIALYYTCHIYIYIMPDMKLNKNEDSGKMGIKLKSFWQLKKTCIRNKDRSESTYFFLANMHVSNSHLPVLSVLPYPSSCHS